MPENYGILFENTKPYMKRMNQKKFTENFTQFTEDYGYLFRGMVEYVGNAGEKEAAAREIGDAIADAARQAHGKGPEGKVPGSVQTDLNMFMIIYVFPSILHTEHADAETTADGVLAAWNEKKTAGPDISYIGYDQIYDGFKRKLFGIF